MTETKKSIAGKAAFAFIAIMLFFTFASKTIHYWTLPKVTAARADSGYIRYTIPVAGMDFYTENKVEIKVPEKLQKSFTIGSITVRKGDIVSKGDTLISFENSSYERILSEQKKVIENLKVELLEFEKSYNININQLQKEIQDLSYQTEKFNEALATSCENIEDLIIKKEEISKLETQYYQKAGELDKNKKLYEADIVTYQEIEKIEKDLKALEEQIKSEYSRYDRLQKKLMEDYKKKVEDGEYNLSKLSEELEYMQETRIFNGKSEDALRRELKEAEQELEFISKYPELKSPIDGIVDEVFYKSMDSYEGVKTIIVLKPVEGLKILMVSLADTHGNKDYDRLLKEDTPCVIKYGNYNIEGKISSEVLEKGNKYLLISVEESSKMGLSNKPNSEFKLPEENENITMEIKGEYCDFLVPNSAFVSDNELFVMKTRKGFWGEEHYLVKQQVAIGEGNEFFTQIVEGLMRSDMIVTGWDRPLNDGTSVTLPLN